MSKYLSALKNIQNSQTPNLINQKNLDQDGLLGLLGTSDGTFENKGIGCCLDCSHIRKPGTMAYCSARPDLPPAYGEGHPLRQLPPDNGNTCQSFITQPA